MTTKTGHEKSLTNGQKKRGHPSSHMEFFYSHFGDFSVKTTSSLSFNIVLMFFGYRHLGHCIVENNVSMFMTKPFIPVCTAPKT
jgi:hypothetical protein